MSIYDEIMIERQRQQGEENFSPKHDDEHTEGQIAQAAASYALAAAVIGRGRTERYKPEFWPWHAKWWKPTAPRRMLIKAAALCVAEIERIDRRQAEIDSNLGVPNEQA